MKEKKEQNIDTETSEIPIIYSLNSDSFNDIREEKNKNIIKNNNEENDDLSKKESLSSLDISNIDIPPINLPNEDYKKSNNIRDDIGKSRTDIIIRKYSSSNENKRYENMNDIYNDNLKFFSFVKDDYNEEDDDIVNNEITSRYDVDVNNYDNNNINKFDSDELNIENINIYSNNNYNNNKVDDLSKNENEIKIFNSRDNNNEKLNEKEFIKKIDNNNIIIINEQQKNKNNIGQNVIIIKKKTKEINGKISNPNIEELEKVNKQRGLKFLNMTKEKRIFQKFLSVSVDTSYFYSLEDDMKILILNPIINYNFPFNKKERELE